MSERHQAKLRGDKRYWTGRPCIAGHVDWRSTGGVWLLTAGFAIPCQGCMSIIIFSILPARQTARSTDILLSISETSMHCSYIPLHQLTVDQVYDVWVKILPFVKKLEARSNGRVTERSLLEEISANQAQLWVAFNDDGEILAFIATKIRQYPKKKLLSFEYIGGEKIEDWFQHAHDFICDWAKKPISKGGIECDGVEAIGRLGWHRFLKPLGWDAQYAVFERMFTAEELSEVRGES